MRNFYNNILEGLAGDFKLNVSCNLRDKVWDLLALMNYKITPREICTVLQAKIFMLQEHFKGNHYHKSKSQFL